MESPRRSPDMDDRDMILTYRPLAQCGRPLWCPPHLLRSQPAGLLHCSVRCFACVRCGCSAHLGPCFGCKSASSSVSQASSSGASVAESHVMIQPVLTDRCPSSAPSRTRLPPSRRCSRASKQIFPEAETGNEQSGRYLWMHGISGHEPSCTHTHESWLAGLLVHPTTNRACLR